jgi:hypothetical protein
MMVDVKDGPVELVLGGATGFLGFAALAVPKAVVDVVAWIVGLFGTDTRPVRLVKGGVDAGLGALAAWDAWAHPKDDFWKGAEWVFATLELLSGGITSALAVSDYVTGSLGPGLEFKAEAEVLKALTGGRVSVETLARRQAFTRTKDTEKTITITLAAGKGTIVSAYAFDETGATITKAYPGQPIGLYVNVRNDGDKDTIWCTIKDKDTGAIIIRKDGIPCDMETIVDSGKSVGWTAAGPTDLNMPNKTWNLLIEAGHGAK